MTLYEDLYYGRYYSSRLPSVRLAGRAAGSGESALQEKERNACSFLQPAAAHRWSQQPNSVTQPGQKQAQMVGHCCLHPPPCVCRWRKKIFFLFFFSIIMIRIRKKNLLLPRTYTLLYGCTAVLCIVVQQYRRTAVHLALTHKTQTNKFKQTKPNHN